MFIATPRSLWCAIALLALFGCGPDDPVVAQVGDVTLTKAEYLRFVERLPSGLQSESALDHLQSLVDQELLLQEARARGIEQGNEVRYQLNALVRKQLSQRYQAEVLAPQIEVTPEEVERTFVDMGFDRERLFARILVRQQRDVDRVLQALHEGEPFAALAQRFAANDLFAPQGDGVVGWIGRTQAQRFAIPPQTFLSLPVGQIAEPLPLAGGWQIYRFVEDRAADKADYAQEAARAAHREKWQSRLQIEVETLSRSLDLQLNHEGLQALLAEPNPADSLAALPLYRFDGGAIVLGEYLYDLRSVGFRAALQDSAQVVSLTRAALLPAYLMAVAAQRRGWDQEARIRRVARAQAQDPRFAAAYQGRNSDKGRPQRGRSRRVLRGEQDALPHGRIRPHQPAARTHPRAGPRVAQSPRKRQHRRRVIGPAGRRDARRPTRRSAPPAQGGAGALSPTRGRSLCCRDRRMGWASGGVGPLCRVPGAPQGGRRHPTLRPSPSPSAGHLGSKAPGRTHGRAHPTPCAPSAQAKSPYSPSACKEVLLW